MSIGPCDWHVIDDQLVVSSIQKNASTSLTTAFPLRIGAEQALEYPVRLAWIRHPIKRVKSVYSCLMGEEIDGATAWHNFVDHMLEVENVHWLPQVQRLVFGKRFVPNQLRRFEDMSKLWPKYSHVKLPVVNASVPLYTDDYREKDLLAYYETDLKVWLDCSDQLLYKSMIAS